MRIELTYNKLSLILVNFLLTVVELLFINSCTYSLNLLPTLSVLVAFNIFIQAVTMKILQMPFKSFFFLFICLLYMFHFGQVYCTAVLDEDPSAVTNMLRTVITNAECAKRLFCIMLGTINSFFVGGIVQSSRNDSIVDVYYDEHDDYEDLNCLKLGIVLFVVSMPLRLYIDIRQLIAAFTGGYYGAIEISVSGVVSCIAGFWYIAVPLIALSIKNDSKRKIFVLFSIGYMLISMLTGNRGHQLVNILAIALVLSYIQNQKIRFGKIIKIAIIGFACLIIINLIYRMRLYGISYLFDNFSVLLEETIENNVISQTLYELGATIKTPYLVVMGLGRELNPFFGETIFRSILVCIPDVTGALNENTNLAILGRVLNNAFNISALGGSFIGELYYDFRQLYWIFAFLFGNIYYKLSVNIIKAIKEKQQWYICKYLPFLVYSLWWVRDSFCGMLRPVVWIAILYVIVRKINFENKSL